MTRFFTSLIFLCSVSCISLCSVFAAQEIRTQNVKMPGLAKIDEIGHAIEKKIQLAYESGGLFCDGTHASYSFEFTTSNQLGKNEMRAVMLYLVETIMQSLLQEPGMQARVQNQAEFAACLRHSLSIVITSDTKTNIVKQSKTFASYCVFARDTLAFVKGEFVGKVTVGFQTTEKESYEKALLLFKQNPKMPRLSFSGEGEIAL